MNDSDGDDERAIDALVALFFSAFTNRDGAQAEVGRIYDLCIPSAVIIKAVGAVPEIWSLPEFIEPRRELLGSGTLVDFEEAELTHRTDLLGNIAQRSSLYRKSGVLNGQPFETRGRKTFQFVRTPAGWRMSAVAWDDEPA